MAALPAFGRVRLALGCLACFAISATAGGNGDRALLGVWRNPQNSVHVEIAPCGATQCGIVSWANEKAKADARDGGTDPLVGVRLLRDIVEIGDRKWRAKAFLPESRKTVSGTIALVDADTLRARSCVLAIICKMETWTRIN